MKRNRGGDLPSRPLAGPSNNGQAAIRRFFGNGQPVYHQEILRDGDLIPDNRLRPEAVDLLEHEAIAKSVAEIAISAETPVNIALFGAWGAGKSSIYTMVKNHLSRLSGDKVTVVRYDAWKYGGKELKRNFVDSIAHELGLEKDPELGEGLHRPIRKVELNFGRWLRQNAGQLVVGLFVALVAAALFALALAGVTVWTTSIEFTDALKSILPTTGAILAPAILAVLLGPKVLEGVTVTTETPAPQEADQFADRFRKLIRKARKSDKFPLVVFIDELDRCAPDEVVSTLRDLKTFLDEPNCAFIVAADRDVIVRALRQEVAQARPVREEEPYYATPGAYLDKIFQHQIALPPLRAKALTEFARTLADAQGGGVWEEMRAAGPDCYDRVIFALVPVHVRSPRRVKVLLNNFATNARVAQARGLDWLDRAHELAILTVLHTEFPAVIHDLRRVPKLLSYLRGDETPISAEGKRIAGEHQFEEASSGSGAQYALTVPSGGEVEAEGPDALPESNDELLADAESPIQDRQGATLTLRRQLHGYLRKVSAAGLRDPRPDLLYLRPAASRDLLPDPALGDAIDFATDTDPAEVAAAFSGQPSTTVAIAIPLLVTEGEGAHGLGRQFAYEAACRLAEKLEAPDFEGVAVQVAPALVSAITAGELSDDSLPGAILMGSVAGSHDAVRIAIDRFDNESPELLGRLATVASFLETDKATLIASACVEAFVETPEPLLLLLSKSPVDSATKLWSTSAPEVVAALNEIEVPPSATPDTRTTATTPKSPAPEPTGAGIALVERLMEVAVARTDGEALLSAIFSSFQTRPALTPFVQWTYRSAERFLAPMSSDALRARHALIGIRAFKSSAWKTWARHLPEHVVKVDEATSTLAASIVLDQILPAFSRADESLTTEELADLAVRVAAWADLDQVRLAEAAEAVLSEVPWNGEEDPWPSKAAAYSALVRIAHSEAESHPVTSVIATDLASALTVLAVDGELVDQFISVARALPRAVQLHLADEVARQYEPTDQEAAEGFRLRLELRQLTGRDALPAEELLALEAPSARVVDAWFALKPSAREAQKVVGAHPATPGAVATYARSLDTEARTDLWISAESVSVSDGLLAAIGRFGVSSRAVDHCREVVGRQTLQSERKATVARLRTASPTDDSNHAVAALRRAAGQLATELLGQSSGDLRTAADLMIWAKGSSPRGDAGLRALFDKETERHPKILGKTLVGDLQEFALLSRRKNFIEKLLGS